MQFLMSSGVRARARRYHAMGREPWTTSAGDALCITGPLSDIAAPTSRGGSRPLERAGERAARLGSVNDAGALRDQSGEEARLVDRASQGEGEPSGLPRRQAQP